MVVLMMILSIVSWVCLIVQLVVCWWVVSGMVVLNCVGMLLWCVVMKWICCDVSYSLVMIIVSMVSVNSRVNEKGDIEGVKGFYVRIICFCGLVLLM